MNKSRGFTTKIARVGNLDFEARSVVLVVHEFFIEHSDQACLKRKPDAFPRQIADLG